jgi:hypothetical protein
VIFPFIALWSRRAGPGSRDVKVRELRIVFVVKITDMVRSIVEES